ncbi:MAG: metal-dependent hydrolase [Euryarchaeota archaeon]|nr:metal-dependent hydrolase [Euryarchaeota archaeon]
MFPILDNHIHLRPDGRGVGAIADFEKAGGTHAILVHSPHPSSIITKPDDFRESYDITLHLADSINASRKVKVFVATGPYPILLLGLIDRYGLKKGVELMKSGMDIAQQLVLEGRAVAIGEIGRPHFPVSEIIWEASNELLLYGMELANEASCPVILHTESGTPDIMKELAEMADRAGLSRDRVIKHYSSPLVFPNENYGIVPSILSSRDAVRTALSKGDRFLMETDFLDDPLRPGAVMNINTVPKRTKAFIDSGIMSEEAAWRIHKDMPEKIYDININI